MATILVGDSLVRKNGIIISELFSKSYPAIGSLLFRICIQYADNTKRAEWIATFLKPWAKIIDLRNNQANVIPDNIMKAIKLQEK